MSCFRAVALAALLSAPAGAQDVIKFATLAPEGSTWMKVMAEFNKELQEKTGGKLRFKFYPGGVSGDEKDVVRKMRIGQLHAAGVTGVGLGEVASEVRVMDAPFLFRGADEVDHALAALDTELNAHLEKGGFVNLGWAEVGSVHLFTNAPLRSSDDMKKVKMWVWEGDPIAEACFKAFNVHPIPLSITDVMTSLQTGLIDGVYGSPMGVIAFQWFTKTKFIYSVPMANASGAVLVSKKRLDALPEESRKVLRELGRKHMTRLTRLSREENRQALATLQRQGLTLTEPANPGALQDYEAVGQKARRTLVGRMYPADLLDKAEKAVAEHRKARSTQSGPGKETKGGKASKG
ncbi:MAG: TRAP transporter substrate-binding protein DctP [Elusimicrobia bacterium]|nr:TRAP transporter substrate-binding protein DctP [Elusimicrobiota bacterium]